MLASKPFANRGLSDDMLGGAGANAQVARRLYLQLANLAFDAVADAAGRGRLNFNASGASMAAVLGVKEGREATCSSPRSPQRLRRPGTAARRHRGLLRLFPEGIIYWRKYLQGADDGKRQRLEAAHDEADQAAPAHRG